MHKIISIYLLLSIFIISCSSAEDELLDIAIKQASDNASEIQSVLSFYQDERANIAKSLIISMIDRYGIEGKGIDSIEALYKELPNQSIWTFDSSQLVKGERFLSAPIKFQNDLQSIYSKYLIDNIEDALNLRNSRKWNNNLTDKQFSELLLPYRIGDEKVTTWRSEYRMRYDSLGSLLKNLNNSVEAAKIVSSAIGEAHYNNQFNTPHRTALSLLDAPVGYCRDDCNRTLYAMRAFGIPVAIDEMIYSPDNGISHQWNVVYDNADDKFRMFDNNRFPPTRDSTHNDFRRKGKVYRWTSEINFDRLEKFKDYTNVPKELMNPWRKDVTAEYFGHNQAIIDIPEHTDNVYLGIFTPGGYKPIDIATVKGKRALFTDIEPQVIYFPIARKAGEEYKVCGNPFMVTQEGNLHEFIPNTQIYEKVTLKRKTALWFHQKERFSYLVGCKTQVGCSANGPWRDVDSITASPSTNYYRIKLTPQDGERFIRFLPSTKQRCQLAEIIAAQDSLALNQLPLSLVSSDPSLDYSILVDGDILKWVKYNKFHIPLIFEVKRKQLPENIFIVSRNDDNFVLPTQEYELLFFSKDGWKSLGSKVSDGFEINFEAPSNAVLWLKNLTRGREEQVFIWKDGTQLFNADLKYNSKV